MDNGLIKTNRDTTKISIKALEDNNLSLKAKGLYALIEYYLSIPGLELYKYELLPLSKDGRDSFHSAWTELKTEGYLVQIKTQDNKGKFIYEYILD